MLSSPIIRGKIVMSAKSDVKVNSTAYCTEKGAGSGSLRPFESAYK